MPQRTSFTDLFEHMIGEIVSDARERVVQEGWFGRTLGEGRSDYDAMVKAWHGDAPERGPDQPARDHEVDMER